MQIDYTYPRVHISTITVRKHAIYRNLLELIQEYKDSFYIVNKAIKIIENRPNYAPIEAYLYASNIKESND